MMFSNAISLLHVGRLGMMFSTTGRLALPALYNSSTLQQLGVHFAATCLAKLDGQYQALVC